LPGGIGYPQGCYERFQRYKTFSSFPELGLAQGQFIFALEKRRRFIFAFEQK
jgi:hypothetical protein